MFPFLRFELIDVDNNRSSSISSPIFDKHRLDVCDTIETVKSVVSQVFKVPLEYISLWNKTDDKYIGMCLKNCSEYSLREAALKIVDETFDDAKKNSIYIQTQTEENSENESQDDNDIGDFGFGFNMEEEQDSGFGSFGSFGNDNNKSTSTSVKASTQCNNMFIMSSSNFLQENFMFDSTSTISSFLDIQDCKEPVCTLKVLILDNADITSESNISKGWMNKYWGRATARSKFQHLKKDVEKYFEIKKELFDLANEIEKHPVKERISVIDYKSVKFQYPDSSKKKLSKYGEDIFESVNMTKDVPFLSMKIPSLDSHQFRMYVGNDTVLGVDDVDKFMYHTSKINGLSIRMINPESRDTYVSLDYKPEYSEITCGEERILFDSTVNNSESYDVFDLCDLVSSNTVSKSDRMYNEFFSPIQQSQRFTKVDNSRLTRLTLKWNMYIPVTRVQDVIDKKLMGPLFKKEATNTSQKKNKYISQNFLKYEFDPCTWSKMGNNLSTKIVCTLRTTSSNSVIVTVQSTLLKRKVIEGRTRNNIDIFMSLWVYDVLRTIILSKVICKQNTPQLTTSLRLKDIDPYLFGESVRNGGYTRKCLNFKDQRIGNAMRFRQPMVINIDCPEDMKLYRSLKYPGPIVKYRNNYYVGMRDEISNSERIEKFNKTAQTSKDTIEYFNTVIFFEIYEENYRAPNAKSGLIYPACVQRKERLSRRHIDLMRQAFFEKDEDRRIEIVEDSVGAKELIDQLKSHEFNINCEVGYIMQASRTLPINSFGRLPSDGSGVYEWFEQNSIDFKKGTNEFLRKGTMHVDHYNFVHAIYDCLNVDGYRDLKTDERVNVVKQRCSRISKTCSFGLFRTLQDGTLAQRIDYESFMKELVSPTTQLLHTEFSNLLSYILSVNIIIFDCDTYSHCKGNNTNYDQRKGSVASSAKMYYTTLKYDRFIYLLKMRGTYEIIVFYDGKVHRSIFDKSDKVVSSTLKLDENHNNNDILSLQLNRLDDKFKIIGQVLNANNQCTHIILAVSEVPIPIDGLCIPFKNDDTRYVPIVSYMPRGLLETLGVMTSIGIKFPEYTPESAVYERRYSKELGITQDIVYAVRLKNGLFCDVIETLKENFTLPDGIEYQINLQLSTPYYPDTVNSIILGQTISDERLYFMKSLNNVSHTFDFIRKSWHTAVQDAADVNFRNFIQGSWKMKNHERRKFMNSFVSQMWDNTINDERLHPFYKEMMTIFEKQIMFVLLNYLYRNPKFFLMPYESSKKRKNNVIVCESGIDVLRFGGQQPLREYLQECTRRQISHLHVTVKKQRRITYLPPTQNFVELDVPLSKEEISMHENLELLCAGTILDAVVKVGMLKESRSKLQKRIYEWLNIFDRLRPLPGCGGVGKGGRRNKNTVCTFNDLLVREDDGAICLALSVMFNHTIEIISQKQRTKSIYGTTLSNSSKDRKIIYYLGDHKFGRPKNQ